MSTRKPQYLTKEVAARVSGRSVRRLLELASKGRIRKKVVKDDSREGRPLSLFLAEDIERLAKVPFGAVGLEELPAASSARALVRPLGLDPKFAALPSLPQPAAAPPRPWLTLDEAADYSGLPRSFLMERIAGGKLAAIDVGVRAGGRWRISRKALDALSD